MRLVHLILLPVLALARLTEAIAAPALRFLRDAFDLFRPEPALVLGDAPTLVREVDGDPLAPDLLNALRHDAGMRRRGI